MRCLSVISAVAITLGLATPALAHTDLVSTTPASGATITTPADIELVFNEPPLAEGASVALEDADGVVHPTTVTGVDGSTVRAAWPEDVPPGMVMINWRVTADDGHVLQGSIHVTYTPAEDADSDATDGDDATATPAANEPSATPVATMSPLSLGPGQSRADITWWITGCVLLAAGGLLIFLLGKRRP